MTKLLISIWIFLFVSVHFSIGKETSKDFLLNFQTFCDLLKHSDDAKISYDHCTSQELVGFEREVSKRCNSLDIFDDADSSKLAITIAKKVISFESTPELFQVFFIYGDKKKNELTKKMAKKGFNFSENAVNQLLTDLSEEDAQMKQKNTQALIDLSESISEKSSVPKSLLDLFGFKSNYIKKCYLTGNKCYYDKSQNFLFFRLDGEFGDESLSFLEQIGHNITNHYFMIILIVILACVSIVGWMREI